MGVQKREGRACEKGKTDHSGDTVHTISLPASSKGRFNQIWQRYFISARGGYVFGFLELLQAIFILILSFYPALMRKTRRFICLIFLTISNWANVSLL